MRLLRFLVFALFVFALKPAGTILADDAVSAERNVYDQLKSGHRIVQEREYGRPEKPTVYLTFDDGPSKLTPKVLDILKEEGVPATFFVLGELVEQHPEYIQRMVKEGHSIGNHTYNHQYRELYQSFDSFWKQIKKTEEALVEAAGVRPSIVRAPGGTFTNFDAYYFYYLDQAGYTVFDWNADSGDALRIGVPASEIAANATKGTLHHEMIVLMHDGTGHEETIKALPDIIRFYRDKGYQFAPLTAQVKPVVFNTGKPKWIRNVTFAEHERLVAQVRTEKPAPPTRVAVPAPADPDTDAIVRLARQGELAGSESAEALRMAAVPPLRLFLRGTEMELKSPDYEFREERFYVPLRTLVERMGGLVMWDDARRTATVRYGLYQLVYDLNSRSVALSSPGKKKQVHYLTSMRLQEGTLFVPLRSAVELLGNRVQSYALGEDNREVRIDLSGDGYYLVYAPDPSPGPVSVPVPVPALVPDDSRQNRVIAYAFREEQV